MFPSGPNDDMVDASGQAINETRSGANTLLDLYKALNADDAKREAEKSQPKFKPAPAQKRTWSEAIRTIGMGVVPHGTVDADELEEWIQFCEANAQTERAAFAKTLKEAQ